jgi:hypothetical protein
VDTKVHLFIPPVVMFRHLHILQSTADATDEHHIAITLDLCQIFAFILIKFHSILFLVPNFKSKNKSRLLSSGLWQYYCTWILTFRIHMLSPFSLPRYVVWGCLQGKRNWGVSVTEPAGSLPSRRGVTSNSQRPLLSSKRCLERTNIWLWVLTGPETKNDCADECQQQSTGLDWRARRPTGGVEEKNLGLGQ